MRLLSRLSLLLRSSQDPLTCSFCRCEWSKQQAQIFKQVRLISLHQKQLIPSSLTKRRAQASLAIQGISCQDFAFPVDVLDEAASHRKFTLLFLCFLLLLLFFPCELALGFLLPLGFDVCFLNMPLGQHYPRLMFYHTDCMHRIAMLLFKLQSSPVRFSINGYGTSSSLLLVVVQEVQKNTAKCCFSLFYAHSPQETL